MILKSSHTRSFTYRPEPARSGGEAQSSGRRDPRCSGSHRELPQTGCFRFTRCGLICFRSQPCSNSRLRQQQFKTCQDGQKRRC